MLVWIEILYASKDVRRLVYCPLEVEGPNWGFRSQQTNIPPEFPRVPIEDFGVTPRLSTSRNESLNLNCQSWLHLTSHNPQTMVVVDGLIVFDKLIVVVFDFFYCSWLVNAWYTRRDFSWDFFGKIFRTIFFQAIKCYTRRDFSWNISVRFLKSYRKSFEKSLRV